MRFLHWSSGGGVVPDTLFKNAFESLVNGTNSTYAELLAAINTIANNPGSSTSIDLVRSNYYGGKFLDNLFVIYTNGMAASNAMVWQASATQLAKDVIEYFSSAHSFYFKADGSACLSTDPLCYLVVTINPCINYFAASSGTVVPVVIEWVDNSAYKSRNGGVTLDGTYQNVSITMDNSPVNYLNHQTIHATFFVTTNPDYAGLNEGQTETIDNLIDIKVNSLLIPKLEELSSLYVSR